MNVFAFIAGVVKAIPVLDKWFTNIYTEILNLRIKKSDNLRASVASKRKTLIRAIENAKDDEEILNLSVILRGIDSN